MLTSDDLAQMEHRARRFAGAYTGTSGTLAADVLRLLQERQRLLAELIVRQEMMQAPYWQQPHD